MPVFGIIYLIISVKESGKAFYKPLLIFMSAIIPAFIILSSYNYILNFIDFGSPFGPAPFIYKHSGFFGIKSFIANMIKYFFLFFDFSGITEAKSLSPILMGIKNNLFHFLGLKTTDGLAYCDLEQMNTVIQENYSMFGILGFLLILPLIFTHGFPKTLSKLTKDKQFYSGLTGLIPLGFIISLSSILGFCFWYNRFLTTAIILGAPVLIFSYSRRSSVLKVIVISIAISSYLLCPVFNESKPLFKIIENLIIIPKEFRNKVRFLFGMDFNIKIPYYLPVKFLGVNAPDYSKIGIIFSYSDWYYPFFEENPTWKISSIDYKELFKHKNYNDYDFLLISKETQCGETTSFKNINYNYKPGKDKVIFKRNADADSPLIYYEGNKGIVITSGKPVITCAAINLKKIPSNFKLIKVLSLKEKMEHGQEIESYVFYIYKKIHNT